MPVPPEIPVVRFPTPQSSDRVLVEYFNTEKASYDPLQPGTPHENVRDYPNHVFVTQQAIQSDEKWIIRIWVNDRAPEDPYNYSIDYSGDDEGFPIFAREYFARRSTYAPLVTGLPLTGVVGIKVTAGGTLYTLPPVISFTGGAGSGAAAIAVVFRGALVAIILTAEGAGYTSAPTVVITPASGDAGSGSTAAALIQPTTALLVKQTLVRAKDDPADSLFVHVSRVWETLPGPLIPSTDRASKLGPIATTEQFVLAQAGQINVLTATGRIDYKARDGSSVVNVKTVQTWSDGTGSDGNPAFPLLEAPMVNDPERGPIHTKTQLVTFTVGSAPSGSRVVADNVETIIRYDQFDQFHLDKVTQTLTLPGPARAGQRWNRKLRFVEPFTKKITEAGLNAGDEDTDIEPISSTEQEVTVFDTAAAQAALDSYFLATPTSVRGLRLPDVLLGLVVTFNTGTGAGSHDTAPSGASSGTSWALSLNDTSHSQGGASILPELTPNRASWDNSNRPPGMTYNLFVPDDYLRSETITALQSKLGRPVTSIVAGVVATGPAPNGTAGHKLSVNQLFQFSSIIGGSGGIAANTTYYVKTKPTATTFTYAATSGGSALSGHAATSAVTIVPVNEMPIWYPKETTITATGQHASVSADASAQQHVSETPDNETLTYSTGEGTSEEIGVTNRSWQLPPMIHGPITLKNAANADLTNPTTASATAAAAAGWTSGTNWPARSATASASKDVSSTVLPLTIAATTPAAWPTEGLYIVEFDAEPFDYERTQVRVQLFDFATITPPA